MKLKDWLAQLAHWASLYLPITVMALLALGSWWLARNAPVPAPVAEVKAPRHEPDYLLTGFVTHSFDKNGALVSEVRGTKARHFPDTDVLEVDGVQTRSFRGGMLTASTANRAYSNGDGSEVQLVGNVHVVRAPLADASDKTSKLQFRGEFLHLFDISQQIKSHRPVTIERGADLYSGDSLFYDHVQGVIELNGRAKASFAPKSAR